MRSRRQILPAVLQRKILVGSEKLFDDLLVFFFLQRAGGIDQYALRAEEWSCCLQEIELGLLVAGKIFRSSVPADVWVTADDAGAGAGCIKEDSVKSCAAGCTEILQAAGKEGDVQLWMQPFHIVFEFSLPLLVRLYS